MQPGPDVDRFAAWPWVSLIYHRVCWNFLEPEEGRFAWDVPEWEGGFGPWLARGFPVGLDVMCANPHGGRFCTPEWVRAAGCRGHFERRTDPDPMSRGEIMDRWVPDYSDPVFREKLDRFLSAFAARYDANPLVEFVTLRSYAAWGEWYGTEEPDEALNWMVDLHCRLFKRTTLLIPVSCPPRWPGVILPAIDRGLGVRKDGLGGPIHPGEHALFDRAYLRSPVMLEFWGPRRYLRDKGWDALFDKEECITAWHASRVNMGFPGQAAQWVEDEPDFLDRMAARMGYCFRLREARFSETVDRGRTGDAGRLRFESWWRNDGVAPYTRPGEFRLILRDAAGREHVIHRDTGVLNRIPPVGHYAVDCAVDVPETVPAGNSDVMVRLVDRYKGATQPIQPANWCEAADGGLVLGRVKVL